MAELRAYDPGDKYTGIAYFRDDGPPSGEQWRCYLARVADPDDALDELASHLIAPSIGLLYVVYERFRLYPDKAQEQSNSEFLTPQGIGVMRWLIRNCNLTRAAKGQEPVVLHHFGAEDKEPARQILRRAGIRSTAKRLKTGPGDHAVDAELHGWHFLAEILGAPLPSKR